MADLIIKGMEMPLLKTELIIFPSGHVQIYDSHESYLGAAQALPLPEKHGDLIDRDALNDKLIKLADNWYTPKVFASWLSYEENAPTIIPAEGGGGDG